MSSYWIKGSDEKARIKVTRLRAVESLGVSLLPPLLTLSRARSFSLGLGNTGMQVVQVKDCGRYVTKLSTTELQRKGRAGGMRLLEGVGWAGRARVPDQSLRSGALC